MEEVAPSIESNPLPAATFSDTLCHAPGMCTAFLTSKEFNSGGRESMHTIPELKNKSFADSLDAEHGGGLHSVLEGLDVVLIP